jgi:Helix-turn-helix of DDE superfamily endonuclease
MLHEKVKLLKAARFRRLTGVQKGTFARMAEVLTAAQMRKHSKHGGRTPRLSIEDRLLMALMYWRENRTYCHVAQAYGMSDSEGWRTIRWIEDTLIRSGVFRLPGKKQLLADGTAVEVVLIDATETPVERPKKSNAAAIPARKSGTR